MELLLQTCVNAVYAASFMALIAVGLMLIFGVMGVINFAHGELFMLGAYWRRVRLRRARLSVLPRGDAGTGLRRPARDPDAAGAVPARAGQSPGRADRLHRAAADAAGGDCDGVRGAHGTYRAADTHHLPSVRPRGRGGRAAASVRDRRCRPRARRAVAVPAPHALRVGAPGVRAGSGGGRPAGHLDPRDGDAGDVHRRGHGRRRRRARGAAGAHLSLHGPFGDHHRVHRHHRRRARQPRGRRGGGDPLRLRAHLRDHLLRRCHRRHRRPAADAGGIGGAPDRAFRRPGNGPEPGVGADAGHKPRRRLLGRARGTLRGPHRAAPPAQLLAEGSVGVPGDQRAGGSELPAADPHRRVVAGPCGAGGRRRLCEHSAGQARWRPGAAGDAAGRRGRRPHRLYPEFFRCFA